MRRERQSAGGQRRDHEENEQGAQSVVAESLPHFGEEENGKAAGMPEPLSAGVHCSFCRMLSRIARLRSDGIVASASNSCCAFRASSAALARFPMATYASARLSYAFAESGCASTLI